MAELNAPTEKPGGYLRVFGIFERVDLDRRTAEDFCRKRIAVRCGQPLEPIHAGENPNMQLIQAMGYRMQASLPSDVGPKGLSVIGLAVTTDGVTSLADRCV